MLWWKILNYSFILFGFCVLLSILCIYMLQKPVSHFLACNQSPRVLLPWHTVCLHFFVVRFFLFPPSICVVYLILVAKEQSHMIVYGCRTNNLRKHILDRWLIWVYVFYTHQVMKWIEDKLHIKERCGFISNIYVLLTHICRYC